MARRLAQLLHADHQATDDITGHERRLHRRRRETAVHITQLTPGRVAGDHL